VFEPHIISLLSSQESYCSTHNNGSNDEDSKQNSRNHIRNIAIKRNWKTSVGSIANTTLINDCSRKRLQVATIFGYITITKGLVTISQQVGNSWVVQAIDWRISATSRGETSIISARIFIEASYVSVNASNGNVTSISCAIVEVVAIDGNSVWNKVASSSVVAEIESASVVVIAEGVLAVSSERVASVSRARVEVIAINWGIITNSSGDVASALETRLCGTNNRSWVETLVARNVGEYASSGWIASICSTDITIITNSWSVLASYGRIARDHSTLVWWVASDVGV
jgi:hypothetical protein